MSVSHATRNPHRVRMPHSAPHMRLKCSKLTAGLKRSCSRLGAVNMLHLSLVCVVMSETSAGVLCLIVYTLCGNKHERDTVRLHNSHFESGMRWSALSKLVFCRHWSHFARKQKMTYHPWFPNCLSWTGFSFPFTNSVQPHRTNFVAKNSWTCYYFLQEEKLNLFFVSIPYFSAFPRIQVGFLCKLHFSKFLFNLLTKTLPDLNFSGSR